MIGTVLGPYHIEALLGKGGMGEVYRASQPSLGRTVAVKTLLPSLAENEEFVERFLREARATARLRHPGIVTIFDVGEQDGVYYFAMEYLEGRTLDRIVREEGPLDVQAAAGFVGQIAHALAHAHSRGILHRDVKPANVIVDDEGRAVLTDFGIARAASETRLTRTGTTIGSPDYMSPEQVQGKHVDQRSDLYALGIIFYQLLTGQVPYQGDSAVSVAFQHVNEPVRSARLVNAAVPEEIDAVLQRAMAKKPEERHGSAGELLEDLESAVTGGVPVAWAETATSAEMRTPPAPAGPGDGSRGVKIVVGALVVLAVALLVTAFLYFGSGPPARVAGGGGPVAGSPSAGSETASGAGVQAAAPGEEAGSQSPGDGAGATVADGGDEAAVGAVESGAESAGDGGTDSGAPRTEAGNSSAATTGPDDTLDPSGETTTSLGSTATEDGATAGPVVETFRILSNPAGATVTINGEPISAPTPATIEITEGERYELELSLPGHESTSFAFGLEDLSTQQREVGELFFPLASATPPGHIVVQTGFPVNVRVGGRSYDASSGTRIPLSPGNYQLELSAPDVYFSDTRALAVQSDRDVPLVLPPVAEINVAATPSYCRVSIDGRDIGYLPTTVRIVVGTHRFRFDWERLGVTKDVTSNIRLDTGRVFEVAPEGAGNP